MSQRHRSQDVAQPPKVELRAHAHNERHRINSELSAVAMQVTAGYEPDEVHEPGRAWVPEHRRDAEKAKKQAAGGSLRHWKVKAWKRRTTVRRAKAAQIRIAAEES
jgi:uncharacterized protein YecT (DUF1311 family)